MGLKNDDMTKKEILKLLRSGDFTIIYWDNGAPSLYKGKNYDVDDFSPNIQEIEIDTNENGYCPGIVKLLVEALKGETNSI